MTQGICRNTGCPCAASATPVERYAGPGEYCPECGELLEPFEAPREAEPPKNAAPKNGTLPFGGLSALQALQQFEAAEPAAPPPPAKQRPRKRLGVALGGAALAAVAVVFFLRPIAMGRAAPSNVVHVCRSEMTERLAGDIVRAYAAKRGLPASRFDLSSSAVCDVRFGAASGATEGVVGYDGIVVIVNPQNPLSHLSNSDVRRIFRGEVTDWSELGGPPGAITAILPEEGTDEALLLARRLALGSSVSASVRRMATGAEIVRNVTSASGRRAIGIVAFSAAVPAKVVTLDAAPAPSTLSIGDQRYPLAVVLTVTPEGAYRVPGADGLIHFARSDVAQTLLAQDGFVPKKGF